MASLSYEKRGGKRQARIWFEVNSGRKSVRIGEVRKRTAETVLSHVRELETCKKLADSPQASTQKWLSQIDDEMHGKLANSGLIETRVRKTIGEFLKDFVQAHSIGKATMLKRQTAERKLVAAFGAETLVNQITKQQAETFYRELTEKHSSAYANKLTKIARQAFKKAVAFGLITENPFKAFTVGDETNTKRQRFISRETIYQVIEAATDNEFRLIIALARFGGLRIPSEPVGMKWGHIDWSKGTFQVIDTKRKVSRVVPIFAELRPYLEAVWNEAPEGSEYVIRRYRSPNVNLRTRFEQTINRAGVQPWPKLWQNLRSTRETELADTYPIQVVTAWIGNSVKVAQKHYLQVTPDHIAHAVGAGGGADGANMVQNTRAPKSTDSEKSVKSENREARTSTRMGRTGLEPVTSAV